MSLLEGFHRVISTPLFRAGAEGISLLWLLKLLLASLIVILFTSFLKRLLRDYLLLRLKLTQGNREAVATLVSYSVGSLGFLMVLSLNGLDIASLAVVLGGLGVGIGFGLQDLTRNLVSGLTLLLEGKLQVGDYIEFNNLSGYIKEISMRSTIVRTFDGGDVVIPNSSLVSHQVLNWSYRNFTGKIRLAIDVAYDSDPILVAETLLNSAHMEHLVLCEPSPKVIFKGFGESALNFELWVWVSQIDQGISIRSSLNYIIEHNFRQAGIKIPFPQREVWLHHSEAQGQQENFTLQTTSFQNSEKFESQPEPSNLQRSPVPISIRRVLQQVPYFQYTSDLYLRGVIEAGYRKLLADAETLFKEEEQATAVYVVLSGAIQVVSVRLNQTVKMHGPGEFFGEAPLMLSVPYLATGYAIGETSVFVIPKANFEKLLHTCPTLAETFAQEVSREEAEYSGLRQQLQDLGFLKMTEQHKNFIVWAQTRFKQLLQRSIA
jgi:small-conductance mechanosensitive channel/CRP-like cAMP-binding protein